MQIDGDLSMICEREKYENIVLRLNKLMIQNNLLPSSNCSEYFLFSDYVNLPSFNTPIYFSDTLYSIPLNVQSCIFHNLEKVCFCLRIRENKKAVIEWIESKLNLKRIQNHKNYRRTYYVFETDDVDVLYTMVKMLCN